MAQQRSRRLRKKMRLDEFQEIGFMVSWEFPEGTTVEKVDAAIDRFISEVFEAHDLSFEGGGYLQWDGLVCLQKIGKCTEEHRAVVSKWLESNGMNNVKSSELMDINYFD
ncbi:YggL family protein [Budvicia diplopodorum]|uniref:YggL 50S ribosome-binding family protein n=1 Tax=Budvicia diplopodorum TaxID=1119056 RepID=UPI001356C8AC|nr:YggL family protein [Budvicia diplopodorum]